MELLAEKLQQLIAFREACAVELGVLLKARLVSLLDPVKKTLLVLGRHTGRAGELTAGRLEGNPG